jgi:parvulin-like peptidyl-prolyl isomerase
LLVEGIADPAFAQDPGTVSGVIETDDGFYILKVDGREVRALEPEARERYARTLFNDRLEATSNEYESQNLVTIEQAQRIASRIQSPGG